ncbi:MAG: arsenate reductase ArsC [Rhodobacteraceae bacterium]|nr:arsenate reductase ArsC [Paracoccaceae bacterium]
MNILVLCTGNSARSILLESILRVESGGEITAFSAGSHPVGQVNPAALKLLARKNHPTVGLRSKSWDEFALNGAPTMDLVITVCGNAEAEICPIWPGAPRRAHWGVDDPAAVVGSQDQIDAAFEAAYAELRSKALAFLALEK